MKGSLLSKAIPVSLLIVLVACIGLRKELKKFRVATRGIEIAAKISQLQKVVHRYGAEDYYADFVGKDVHMVKEVSKEFYFTHRADDVVNMKYLPDEDIILFGYESAGDTFILRGIFLIFAIVLLIFARRIDVLSGKERIRKKQRN